MTAGSHEVLMSKKLARHAWRLGWVLLGVQVAATAAGIAGLSLMPKQYRSSTTIRVEKSQLINPLTRGLAVTTEMEDRVRSLREEILSRDYFEKIIVRLGLEEAGATPIQHEERLQAMIRNTQVNSQQSEADTFQITYVGGDPRIVRDVTNLLAGIFIEESLANKADEAGSAVEFLRSQLEIYRKKLEEAETALRQFEEQHVDQVPATRAAQVARVEQMRSTLIEVQGSLRQSRLQRELLRQRLAGTTAAVPGVAPGENLSVPNPIQGQIREKEAQLRQMLIDYAEGYPDVIALRGQIAQLRQELAAHPTVSIRREAAAPDTNTAQVQDALSLGQLQQLEVEISSLATREEQLQSELARYDKKIQGIPLVEQELARLKRDYDVNNDIYNNFLRRLEEARVSQTLESSRKGEVFRVLQAAALPLAAFRPTRSQGLALGLGAALLLNAGLLLLFTHLDTSFQSSSDVKAFLGIKVLAGMPRCRSRRQKLAEASKAALIAAAGAAYVLALLAYLFWERVGPRIPGGG